MRVNVACYAGRKADERPIRFWLEGERITLMPCLISGMTPRASSTRSAGMTEISISFDNTYRRRLDSGSWFRFARQDKSQASRNQRLRAIHICRPYQARLRTQTNTPATVRTVAEISG
jgi:hypothetical protein